MSSDEYGGHTFLPSPQAPLPIVRRVVPEGRREEAVESGRLRRAATRAIKKIGPGQYVVQGTVERCWYVDLSLDYPCQCPDAQYRGARCLHTIAAQLQEREPGVVLALGELLLQQQHALRDLFGEEGDDE